MKKFLFGVAVGGTLVGVDTFRYIVNKYPNDPIVLLWQNNKKVYGALFRRDWETFDTYADRYPRLVLDVLNNRAPSKK